MCIYTNIRVFFHTTKVRQFFETTKQKVLKKLKYKNIKKTYNIIW